MKLTDDKRQKCCIAFSADGLRVAYTVYEPGPAGWRTFTLPFLGGEPRALLSNAAGPTWLDSHRFLFSEIRTGFHMGIVSSVENRTEYRQIYFPKNERGMAHFSYASPDRKWALVVEMDPDWQPCRLVPLNGSSEGRPVGPQGPCTSAGWSPDGKWRYFGAEIADSQHLWRQRFPSGDPEQITFGPTREDGIAVAPHGRSLVTSVGIDHTTVWLRDDRGERSLSSQGRVISSVVHGILPKFSSDGKSIFYLNRRKAPRSVDELWRTDVASGNSEPALPGVSMVEYGISDNGTEVVYSTRPPGKSSQLWLASLDRSLQPRLIASSGESLPHFSYDAGIVYQFPDGNSQYVGRMNRDGSGRSRVFVDPVDGIQSISGDGRWLAAVAPVPDGSVSATIAIPIGGGVPSRICTGYCPAVWSRDSKFLYVGVVRPSQKDTGKTFAIPIPQRAKLPRLPSSWIHGLEDEQHIPGARVIEVWDISPGPDPSTFAYVKATVQRNLFRIPLRDR